MIEARDVTSFKRTIEAISSFISEGNFRFSENGISLRAVDPSQIVLVDCFIDKKSFTQYDLEPSYVGMDVVELSRMLSRSLTNDVLFLDLDDNEMRLHLKGDFSRSFHLPLIDVSEPEKELKLPNQQFTAVVEINARVFKELLKDALLFGSTVVLKVADHRFAVEAKGSQGALKTISAETSLITVTHSSNAEAKYSLNFLANIVKEAENDSIIKLEFKSDAPMRISYKIGSTHMQYYLAHMIL
ncbi:MAG: hypothetical protein AABY11_03090 [archaeon]